MVQADRAESIIDAAMHLAKAQFDAAAAVRRGGAPTVVVQQFDLSGSITTKEFMAQINQLSQTNAVGASKAMAKQVLKPHVLGPAISRANKGRFT